MKNNSQKAMLAGRQGFAMPVIIAVVAVVLVLGGVVYYSNKSKEADKMAEEKAMMEKEAMEQEDEGAMMEKESGEMMEDETSMMVPAPGHEGVDEMIVNEDVMMDKGEIMMKYSGAVLAGKSAPLLDFAKADYDAAIKTDKLVVLYFYANWCPICKAEFPIMQKIFNGLNTDKVIGFRVNYNDNQTDNDERGLAREFGVAYQHTKVFVKNGQRILKSPEGWDEKRYDTEISKALGQ